jgi:gamma-glutamyltranspeptidase/glutathione hydrolase
MKNKFMRGAAVVAVLILGGLPMDAQKTTEKPVLHGRHWIAITGKPMAATAGAQIFMKGGNAVDAACASLGRATVKLSAAQSASG